MKATNAIQTALVVAMTTAVSVHSETLTETYSKKVSSGATVTGGSLTAEFVFSSEYSAGSANNGVQIGKEADPAMSATITVTPSSYVDKAVRSVTIQTRGASGVNATVSANVNELGFGNPANLTSSFQNLVFPALPSSSPFDNAVFSFDNKSAKALYVKSISVELNESPEVVAAPDAITAQVGAETTVDLADVFGDSDDPNGLYYEVVSGPGSIADGIWSWTPFGEESGTVTIRATDPYNAETEVSFDVASTLDAVAPNVILSAQSATTVIGAGAVETTVSADSADAVLSMYAPPEAESPLRWRRRYSPQARTR